MEKSWVKCWFMKFLWAFLARFVFTLRFSTSSKFRWIKPSLFGATGDVLRNPRWIDSMNIKSTLDIDGFSKHESSLWCCATFLFPVDLQVSLLSSKERHGRCAFLWMICYVWKLCKERGATMPQNLGCLQGDFQTNSSLILLHLHGLLNQKGSKNHCRRLL